jgi:hypothetical protein
VGYSLLSCPKTILWTAATVIKRPAPIKITDLAANDATPIIALAVRDSKSNTVSLSLKMTSSYDLIKNARMTSSEVMAEEQAHDPYVISETKLVNVARQMGYKPSASTSLVERRLHLADFMLKSSGYPTLQPLLPLLLSIRGKPYHLHDHFPFAPFFRTRMARTTLLKTGRQVSKSTSLAAQGVLFSNCIPYFSTLFLTPLFEMIRRFSQNYVAEFITTSPVGRLFTDETTVNNVLQRSFKNRSKMIFSFAYLDAERTRGISADKNCLVGNTMLELSDGNFVAIKNAKPGMAVLSTDKNGTISTDVITEVLYHGVQPVFEVKFSGGEVVRCTADERFRTASTKQWKYLAELVPELLEFQNGQAKAEPGQTFKLPAETNATRLLTRRFRNSSSFKNLKLPNIFQTRTETKTVLSGQSRHFGRVCFNPTERSAQPRLRKKVGNICYCFKSCVSGNSSNCHRRRQKNGNYNLGKSTGLGGNSLLVHGRRKLRCSKKQLCFSYTRVFKSRVRNTFKPIKRAGHLQQGDACKKQKSSQAVLRALSNCREFSKISAKYCTLGASVYALQNPKTKRNSNLFNVWIDFFGSKRPAGGKRSYLQKRKLQKTSTQKVEFGISRKKESCESSVITCVTYVGLRPTWDINTAKYHSFFANGVNCHNCIDEIQDMDISFLPVIHETISASRSWGIKQYAGTPKTLDNTIERLWIDSSMAEWIIKCPHGGCGHWNIPSLDHDLLKMIGPVHDGISDTCPGVICAKCAKPINPRPPYQGGTGRWLHRHPDKRWSFAGYHVPQLIMPMHYASREKWQTLVDKRDGKGNTPIHVFYNEVCGESWDSGSKLVTITDLKRAACLPWKNTMETARNNIDGYLYRFVAVDWGGGGVSNGKSDLALQSYTSIAVCGLCPDGRVDVIYGYRSMTPHEHEREAGLILNIMGAFKCSHVVHDYTGAGTVRETLLVQARLPRERILPVAYTGPAKGGLIGYKPANPKHPRDHYVMDRNRALNYCCQFIKGGVIRFFEYDYKGSDDVGLLHDFLNLIEDKAESGSGRDTYKILRDPAGPDDFAQAVTMGSMMLFQMAGRFPDLSAYKDIEISDDVLLSTQGIKDMDWY